ENEGIAGNSPRSSCAETDDSMHDPGPFGVLDSVQLMVKDRAGPDDPRRDDEGSRALVPVPGRVADREALDGDGAVFVRIPDDDREIRHALFRVRRAVAVPDRRAGLDGDAIGHRPGDPDGEPQPAGEHSFEGQPPPAAVPAQRARSASQSAIAARVSSRRINRMKWPPSKPAYRAWFRVANARAPSADAVMSRSRWTTSAGRPAAVPVAGAPEIRMRPASDGASRGAS